MGFLREIPMVLDECRYAHFLFPHSFTANNDGFTPSRGVVPTAMRCFICRLEANGLTAMGYGYSVGLTGATASGWLMI